VEMVLAYLTIWLLKVYPVMTLFLMSTSCHTIIFHVLYIFSIFISAERDTQGLFGLLEVGGKSGSGKWGGKCEEKVRN